VNPAVHSKGSWDDLWRQRKRLYVYRNVVEAASSLGTLNGLRILEVGCGRGVTLLELARGGAQVTGLDYSPEAMAVCHKFCGELNLSAHATFVQGDAFNLPFSSNSFDFVYSVGLIEHFENPAPLLTEQYRALRPGGTLFVQVPQKYSLYTVAKTTLMRFGKWPYGGWETQFSRRELAALVANVGFEAQLSYGYGSFLLATIRHLAIPNLDFGNTWRLGMRSTFLRAIKANTALDLCLIASKPTLRLDPISADEDADVLVAEPV
jgi:SAM-dependent methyltransferase